MRYKGLLFIFLTVLVFFPIEYGCTDTVKKPAVAGAFYPADKEQLAGVVDTFIAGAQDRPVNGRLIALIAPHAGYRYSGQIAGYTYNYLKGMDISTVVLIGPSHKVSFKGVSVYESGKMETPLGLVKIDSKIARSLINKEAGVTFYPEAFEKEHSLEVQLPFLQRMFKEIKIVPILIGTPTRDSYRFLTKKLTEIMKKDEKIFLIASTDFSHYHDYDTAVAMDRKTINSIERMSIEDAERLLTSRTGEMCGGYPVLYTMAVARGLGATNGVLYRYTNSGDVTGDLTRVVGYAAMGLYSTPLTVSEKKNLLEYAKNTVKSYVEDGKIPDIKIDNKRLLANGATFVTLKKNHVMLRGCIGNIMPTMPLYQSVIRNAVNASSKDLRFPPVKPEELKEINVEVTILSPLEPVIDKKAIRVGTHGLYLVKGSNSGILLPQVPVEQGWDRLTFLRQVSRKAGLPEDAWKDADLYWFTAEIIK